MAREHLLATFAERWRMIRSLKVRRIALMQELGLPLDETHVLTAEEIVRRSSKIGSLIDGIARRHGAAFVRTAWHPDLLCAPWFRCYESTGFFASADLALEQAVIVSPRHQLTHFIVHSNLGNPSDPSDRFRYLTGRLLFHQHGVIPLDRTIEIVHGEYFPRIFDTKDYNLRDDRFAIYQIKTGEVCWRPVKESPLITAEDMRILVRRLREWNSELRQLLEFLAFADRRDIAELALTVDFLVSKGSNYLFHLFDFDYSWAGGALGGGC